LPFVALVTVAIKPFTGLPSARATLHSAVGVITESFNSDFGATLVDSVQVVSLQMLDPTAAPFLRALSRLFDPAQKARSFSSR
jgi:hypothetical protein